MRHLHSASPATGTRCTEKRAARCGRGIGSLRHDGTSCQGQAGQGFRNPPARPLLSGLGLLLRREISVAAGQDVEGAEVRSIVLAERWPHRQGQGPHAAAAARPRRCRCPSGFLSGSLQTATIPPPASQSPNHVRRDLLTRWRSPWPRDWRRSSSREAKKNHQ
jgi:hypothetical protein